MDIEMEPEESSIASTSERLPVVVSVLRNEKSEPYFIRVRCASEAECGRFLRLMWLAPVGNGGVPRFAWAAGHDDEYFLQELTDRGACLRTSTQGTFGDEFEVVIRTHAWSPRNDDMALPAAILEYVSRACGGA